jgi:hypothetical protein
VSVDWRQSPRLIFVAAPSTEITIQDLHDTLRVLEERPGEGLPYPSIVETAGKEELGGGVTVGLTMKLLNARLAFQGRKTSVETGAITTADTSGYRLIDSNATFVTNGVLPGAWIVNLTDGSRATVLRVVSQTELETDVLGDGVDNQFNLADAYEVQNVTQVEVSGGNLVAVDVDLVTSIDPILPTVGTQVVRTSSSSATLQELQDIQFSSFQGGVTVNVGSSYAGTDYPIGTPRQPVNNMIDAVAIANARGLLNFYIQGDLTIGTGVDVQAKTIIGQCLHLTTLVVQSGALVQDAEFVNLTLQGTLDGHTRVRDCIIEDVTNISGIIQRSQLKGTLAINGPIDILSCSDGIAGLGTPIFTFNSGGSPETNIRDFFGGLTLREKSGSDFVSIDCSSARIVLENTITNGTFVIRGIGKLTDDSTGSTIVDSTNLVNPTTIAQAVAPAVWSTVVDGTITAEQSMRLMNAILGSKVSGAGTGTETFRNPDDNKNRVISTVDAEGNRTTIVRDLS